MMASRRRKGARFGIQALVADYPFWTLIFLLCMAFLLGGSGRADPISLLLLRPLSALALATGLIGISRSDVRRAWPAAAILLGIILLVAIHLIPLPPGIWTVLPGRDLAAAAAPTAGLPQPWRPISLVPWRAWNALYSLIVPAAALLLTLQCDLRRQRQLVVVTILLTGLSVAVAIMQTVGGFQPGLYPYAVTNVGSPVGLFANRNHQAALLCSVIPMLAYFASGAGVTQPAPWRAWGAAAFAAMTLLLLLATGSRSGLLVGAVALALIPLLYRPPAGQGLSVRARRGLLLSLGAAAISLLVILALMAARATAFGRFANIASGDEERFQSWRPIARLAWHYFPFGSGIGSFVEVYQTAEANSALKLTYLNHAHFDWLEWLMEGGLPAALLMAGAVILWLGAIRARWRDFRERRPGGHLSLTASAVMFLLGLASFSDYPLRTPALACVMAVMSVLALSGRECEESGEVARPRGARSREKVSAMLSSEGSL